jgi:hypothetical protein
MAPPGSPPPRSRWRRAARPGSSSIRPGAAARDGHDALRDHAFLESQERMLMVLEDGREAEALAVFAKWGLDCAVVGRVTDTGRMVLTWQGRTVADVPVAPVSGARRSTTARSNRPGACRSRPATARPVPHAEAPLRLMGSPDLASKRWIWEQYDHMVMADTAQRPTGDAVVVRIHSPIAAWRSRPTAPPLLLCRSGARWPSGRWQRRGATWSPWRAPARDHPAPNFGNPNGRGSWASRRLCRGHGGSLPGTRLPGRRVTSRPTTRPTATRSCRRRTWAASA